MRSYLEGKRWERKGDCKRGGREWKEMRKKERKWNRSSSLFFLSFSFSLFLPLPFLLSPSFISSLSFPLWDLSSASSRTLTGIAKIYLLVVNNILLDYELLVHRARFRFPQCWPDVQLRTINQPCSGGQGKGWQRPSPMSQKTQSWDTNAPLYTTA